MGLVGVGLLGSALADRLMAGGFQVVAFDIDPSKLARVAADAFKPADSLVDVAKQCRRIVLCLPNSDVVFDVVVGPSGLSETVESGTTLIDTTTGDPDAAQSTAATLAAKNIAYLDATVSGSSAQLRRRDVTLLVGADESAFAENADVFAAWADRVFHTGPVGSGARTKLLVNQVLGLHRLALAECLALAEKLDVDPRRLLEILKATPAYSRVMDAKGPKMIDEDFTPQAKLAQHRKDVGLLLQLAGRVGATLPVSSLHAELLDAAIASGWGPLDNSAVIRVFRDKAL